MKNLLGEEIEIKCKDYSGNNKKCRKCMENDWNSDCKIIRTYTTGVMDRKISPSEWRKMAAQVKQLKKDGYDLEQIQYATEYCIERYDGKINSFGFVMFKIEEALASRSEQQDEKAEIETVRKLDWML